MAMDLVSSSLLREVRSKANFVVARQQSRRPRNRFRLIARSATKHTSSSRERSRWRCTRSSARSATTRISSSLRSPARHASNGACGDIAQHNGRPRRPPRQYRPISNGDSGAIALPWSSSSPGGWLCGNTSWGARARVQNPRKFCVKYAYLIISIPSRRFSTGISTKNRRLLQNTKDVAHVF